MRRLSSTCTRVHAVAAIWKYVLLSAAANSSPSSVVPIACQQTLRKYIFSSLIVFPPSRLFVRPTAENRPVVCFPYTLYIHYKKRFYRLDFSIIESKMLYCNHFFFFFNVIDRFIMFYTSHELQKLQWRLKLINKNNVLFYPYIFVILYLYDVLTYLNYG